MSLTAGRPSKTNKQATLADMADKPATVRVNFDLDLEMHKKLKIYCVQQGRSVKDVLTDLVSKLP